MYRLLASIYIYIYNNLYTTSDTYDQLTTYSNAIRGVLEPAGSFHSTYMVVRTLAMGMLGVYFVISLGTKLSDKQTSPAIVFKTLLEYFVGFALAFFSFNIVSWLFQYGDWLASMVTQSSISDTDDFYQYFTSFATSLKNLDFTDQVLYTFKGLIPYIICVIGNIIIIYAILTRVLRICVNAVMSPIAIINFFDESRHSDGVRFLKRTLSMCLQCSAILVITVAVSSMAGYMTSNFIYSDSLNAESSIIQAQNSMIESLDVDHTLVGEAILAAKNELGPKSITDAEITAASLKLQSGVGEVTPDKESTFKDYENTFRIEIFKRDESGNYIYNDDGYATLNDQYMTFSEETMLEYMNVLLGGNNYLIFIMLLVVRIGLIKQSASLCNTIVGL